MKQKRILGAAALLAIPTLLLFTSCDPALRGEGPIETETRDVENFKGLDVALSGDVLVKAGSEFKVEVSVEESILPYLITRVESDSILHVYFSRNVKDVDGLEIVVTMPELNLIRLSGSAELLTQGTFEGNAIDFELAGSCEIRTDELLYDNIGVQLSGSGKIDLNGAGDELYAQISGSGQIDALNYPVRKADFQVSGSGSVKTDVSELLKARISGSGDIFYRGNPQIDSEISGSGKLTKI